MSKWLASSLNLGLVPERLLVESQSAYSCAGSLTAERRVVAAKVKGFDSLPALIRESSSWLGHQALNLRTLVQIQPPVHGRVMKLVHVLASKARFCGFESHLCHHGMCGDRKARRLRSEGLGLTPNTCPYASVAQLVEQAALNRHVAGPIPVRGTIGAGSSSGLERLSYKEEAEGSNPSLPTMFTRRAVFTASATRGGSGWLGTGLQNRSDGFDPHSLLQYQYGGSI
jgi:hypothetical protein